MLFKCSQHVRYSHVPSHSHTEAALLAEKRSAIRRLFYRFPPDKVNRTPIVGLKKFRFDDRRCGSFVCMRIEGDVTTMGSGARRWDPSRLERIFFQLVMAGGGKVGVVIFFSISAWFFLDKEQTIKSNLKRVWIMERELLFWSLTLMAFYLMLDRACIDAKLMIKSIAPLSMSLWWYATAYAIFLALLPFLSKGLKALGRKYHLALAITVLIIRGLTSFIPGSLGGYPSINSSLTGVFGFIYLFIIISTYKWYMTPFTLKNIGVLLGTGIGLSLLFEFAPFRIRFKLRHYQRLEASHGHDRIRHLSAV